MYGMTAGKDFMRESAYRLRLFEMGRIMRRNKIAILCYHRFSSEDVSRNGIPARLFEKHLQYLSEHFTIISFKDIKHLLTGKLYVRNPLIISVDDGYRDFIEIAVPLLKKYGIPATLFVTTRFADGDQWLWPDIIHYSLRMTEETRLGIKDAAIDLPIETSIEKELALNTLTDFYKLLKETEKAKFLEEITERLNVSVPDAPTSQFRAVSWEDLRQLDQDLIEVGSHTLTHVILSRCSSEKARTEIIESKKQIEQELDREVIAFAYPNGIRGDFTEEHKAYLKEAKYLFAVSCNFGFNGPNFEPFDLNRIVACYKMSHFVQQVSGFESLKRRILPPANNHQPLSNHTGERLRP